MESNRFDQIDASSITTLHIKRPWIQWFCVFLLGVIMGMIFTGFMTLIILDNRMDRIQPSLSGLGMEIDAMSEELHSLHTPIQHYCEQANTASLIMQDLIEVGHREKYDYRHPEQGRD